MDVVVHARLRFPPTGHPATLARLNVAVQDVTLADAAATVLAEVTRTDVEVPADGLVLDVDVPTPAASPGRRYTVRVHGGAGPGFAAGDFLCTRTVPVLLAGDEHVDVPLTHLR